MKVVQYLNFSEWHRPQKEATEAADEVTEGEMPPVMYRLMHSHARLSAEDAGAWPVGLPKHSASRTIRRRRPEA